MKSKSKKQQETRNLVAKHDFNRGGFHTQSKYNRKEKHKANHKDSS